MDIVFLLPGQPVYELLLGLYRIKPTGSQEPSGWVNTSEIKIEDRKSMDIHEGDIIV